MEDLKWDDTFVMLCPLEPEIGGDKASRRVGTGAGIVRKGFL